MRPLFINGRFLTQPLTGVQRYAGNIVQAIDDLLDNERDWPPTFLVTPGFIADPGFRNVRHIAVGRKSGHIWDQVTFRHAARSGVILGLANSVPVARRRSIAVLHDAAVFRHPEFFSPSYTRAHILLSRAIARTSRLATVSNFSRYELAEILGVPSKRIIVAPNGTEHMSGPVDDTVISRLGVANQPFFLTLGNRTRNKNIALVASALKILGPGHAKVVAVGDVDARVFGSDTLAADQDFIAAGRLPDEQIRALMKHAQALIFPSFYEGFGIPPLEAMHHGCLVLASTAGAVVETCGDAADYFDPADALALARLMGKTLDADPDMLDARRARGIERAASFSWQASAQTLLSAARDLAQS
jgi:glycosyltransferase involved in cell wall biosynthesis